MRSRKRECVGQNRGGMETRKARSCSERRRKKDRPTSLYSINARLVTIVDRDIICLKLTPVT